MIAVVQRVIRASARVNDQVVGQIGAGLLALVSVCASDASPGRGRSIRSRNRSGHFAFSNASAKGEWTSSIKPSNASWFDLALLDFYLNRDAAYAADCKEILAHFAQTRVADTAGRVAFICLLSPVLPTERPVINRLIIAAQDATATVRAEIVDPSEPLKIHNYYGGKDIIWGREKHLVVYFEIDRGADTCAIGKETEFLTLIPK